MLRTGVVSVSYINKIVEILISIGSFFLAYLVHEHLFVGLITHKTIDTPFYYIEIAVVCSALIYFLGTANGYFGYDRFYDSEVVVRKLILTYVQSFAYTVLIFYLFRRFVPSRSMLSVYFVLCVIMALTFRYIERKILQRLHLRGRFHQNVLIVGTGLEAEAVVSEMKANEQWGFNIIAILERNDDENPDFAYKELITGNVSRIEEFIKMSVIDLVIFAVNPQEINTVRNYVVLCEEMGVLTMINLSTFEMKIAKTHVEYLGVIPMITFSIIPTKYRMLIVKYVIDRILSFILLVFAIPIIFLPIALIIKLTSKGPVFYVQERMGLRGRRFMMLKFRTMVEGAEDLLDGIQHANEVDGPVFKMKNDPRITAIGRFLRAHSIDEFPQLFNVLAGHMSLVGPRPPIPAEVERYQNEYRRRLSVKPGLTCLWQVSGRSDLDFRTWMEMDMKYIDTWSLFLDFYILLKTIPVVLFRKGAY